VWPDYLDLIHLLLRPLLLIPSLQCQRRRATFCQRGAELHYLKGEAAVRRRHYREEAEAYLVSL